MAKRKAIKRKTPKYTKRENFLRSGIANLHVDITRLRDEVATLKGMLRAADSRYEAADRYRRMAETKLLAYQRTLVMRGPVKPMAIDGEDLGVLDIPIPDITTLSAVLDALIKFEEQEKAAKPLAGGFTKFGEVEPSLPPFEVHTDVVYPPPFPGPTKRY